MSPETLKKIRRKTFQLINYLVWLIFSPFKFKKISKSPIKSILIVNLGFIGDLLATTPLIKCLSKSYKIDVAVRSGMETILQNNPHINKILVFENYPAFEKKIHQKYQLAITIYPCSLKMFITLLKAKITYRIGYAQTAYANINSFFLTRCIFPSLREVHKVKENLFPAKYLKVTSKDILMETFPSKKDGLKVDSLLRKNKIRNFAIIHPGKRSLAGKNYLWDEKKFAEIVNHLNKKHALPVIIGGSSEDSLIAKNIISNLDKTEKVYDFTGKLKINEYASLISKSKILVSIDTSAIHFAAASKTKTVALFCTYPETWHPWQHPHNYTLIFNKKVRKIPTEKVKKAIDALLKGES
ncbi:MAG: glycosyltransferase family 9 protein [archaeon]